MLPDHDDDNNDWLWPSYVLALAIAALAMAGTLGLLVWVARRALGT